MHRWAYKLCLFCFCYFLFLFYSLFPVWGFINFIMLCVDIIYSHFCLLYLFSTAILVLWFWPSELLAEIAVVRLLICFVCCQLLPFMHQIFFFKIAFYCMPGFHYSTLFSCGFYITNSSESQCTEIIWD